MSSKNLFDKGKSYKVLSSVDPNTLGQDAESYRNIRAQVTDKNRFVPNVDFASASNFVRYGSAKKYYETAFDRVTNEYPYDGSSAEKQEFFNNSSYLDLHLFDNEYPTTTGYGNFAVADDPDGTAISSANFTSATTKTGWTSGASTVEYVKIYGGPHTSSNGMVGSTIHSEFSASNIYDSGIYDTEGVLSLGKQGTRESNLKFDLSKGVTTEFWVNFNSDWPVGGGLPVNQVLYDQWNGTVSSSAGYGRFLVFATSSEAGSLAGQDPIRVHLGSGSNIWDVGFGGTTFTTASLKDTWNHIALSFISSSSELEAKFYVNGNLHETKTNTTIAALGEITGSLIAHIGAGQTPVSGANATAQAAHSTPFSPFSGSMDEFRYWKASRTHEEIAKNYFRHVDGGTNTDIANTELGVYFKFNEGTVGNTTTDSTVLDYSGRITNGTWVNYPGSGARNSGSAIVSASAAPFEVEDPIIYADHPLVSAKRAELVLDGSSYDYQNNSSIYYSLPSWIIEEEEEKGGEILNLTQIMGSYFDTLHSQIKEVNKLKNINYISSSHKPHPFSNRSLESSGLFAPEIFVDADVLEQFKGQSETALYEKDLSEIKNLIYQNIYNNLVYIYKSKGTEKSFRNIIRCYGVDDELIKINLYGNNITHKLRDNFRSSVTRRKFADFNHPTRFGATITHQTSSTNANTLDVTYLSCSSNPSTAEIEVIFPKKFNPTDQNYFSTDFLSSSVFGYHRVNTSRALQDFGRYSTAADRSLQVYAVRTFENSKDVYFVLQNPNKSVFVTSSVYQNAYDDTKWNFAIRTYLDKKDSAERVSGSSGTAGESNVVFELYGVNTELGVVKNEFTINSTLAQSSTNNGYLANPRRYYVGANRTNFTGSVVTDSDVKATSLRHWNTFLSNEEVIAHAKNTNSYGLLRPYESAYLYDTDLEDEDIPRIETLALHWNLDDVATSDANGEFLVNDFSSGSVGRRTRYRGDFGHSVGNQYTGRGFFFPASSTDSVAVEYVQTAVTTPPEVVTGEDMTRILDFDDETFTRDSRTINHFFAIEKSMYQTVSEEMLNMFSTIVGFNNLIGEPVNRYRQEYKDLGKLRSLFFENVENTPDLDKYVDFYRWIDSSLSVILSQLIPASANTSEDIRTMVESHVLERAKYENKFPTIGLKAGRLGTDLLLAGGIAGAHEFIPEEIPNYRYTQAPISNDEADNTIFWKYADATNPILSSSNAGVNETRAAIIASKRFARNRRKATPVKITFEVDQEDKVSRFGTGRRFIHGGVNLPPMTRPGAFIDSYTERYGDAVSTLTRDSDSVRDINDVIHPMHKRYFTYSDTGPPFNEMKLQNYHPVRFLSGGLDTGYNTTFADFQAVNLHSFESYHLGGEIPMQTPFTEKFVGGFLSRHQGVSDGTDDASTRAESFFAQQSSTSMRFQSMDDGLWPRATRPYSVFTRNVKVKRPVNIENLQITTGSETLGNYTKIREVVQVAGKVGGDSQFVANEGVAVTNITSTHVDGITDREILHPSGSNHMMTTRFSSPGGPDTSHGSLDVATLQFSVYNALPFRNLVVRAPLRTLLSASTSQFGFKPGVTVASADYSGVANFHKVNRNTLNQIEYSNAFTGDAGTVATASVNDNMFMTRPIPQSDLQYAWLSSSYESTPIGGTRASGRRMLGYTPRDFEVSTSAGYVNAITFNSQSDYSASATTGLVDSPSRLGIIIRDPVSASAQVLGFPLGTHAGQIDSPYVKVDVDADQSIGFLPDAGGNGVIGGVAPAIFYSRGYVYGYSTWKQIRGYEHPVAQALRESHIVSVLVPDRQSYTSEGRVLPAQRYGSFKQFRESPIISKYKPIVQTIGDYDVASSYGNNISHYSSQELNQNYAPVHREQQVYDKVKDLYDNFIGLSYAETVYPAERNVYDNRIRQREGYTIDYWHSDRATRTANKANKISFGGLSRYSIWAMDSREATPTAEANLKAENVTSTPTGELQNYSTQGHFGTKTALTASALYALKHWVATTSSATARSGISITNAGAAAGTGDRIFGFINVGGGNAKWQTGNMAGRMENGVFVTSSANRQVPAYDSYSDYADELRARNKDYSIIPEFRISDHMSYYISTNSGDFHAMNTGSFDIFGATVSSDYPTDSTQEQFYNVYTNSDFLKYFDVIKEDHTGIASSHSITLKCKALMKFLPYDGFYPAERTLQMATQFSSSYAKHVEYTGADSTYENAKIRPFLEPMFAPGIVYNSIKSGIGVPYPVLTASYSLQTLGSYYAISSSANGSKFRMIDFEAALEPEKYLTGVPLIDMAPHPSASLNLTASWDGRGDPLYSMMAHNFFGEVPEFFLPQGNMTTITSLPESDPRFGNAVSGSVYNMRIKMYRSMNIARSSSAGVIGLEFPQDNPLQTDLHETFTMYSRPSAFFHAVTGRNSITAGTDHDGAYTQQMLDSYSGYNWVATPPYYHGEAWLDVQFTATETKKYTLAEILGGIDGTLELRFDRAGGPGPHPGNNGGYYSDGAATVPTTLRNNILNLADTIITDGRARIKSVTYDPATGDPITVSDDPDANHVAYVIQPKWETPMLNFGDSLVDLQNNLTIPTHASESVPRGMWHQFGLPPESPDQGIFLQVTDIPQDWMAAHPQATGTAYYNDGDVESLVDLLGLDQVPRRLGEIATSKTVKEAVIAVPFIEKGSRKEFFEIPEKAFRAAMAGKLGDNNSVQNMVTKLKNYVLPPRMDFITCKHVKPFAMYVFEFEHDFDKDDLVHIWQNLPPKSVDQVQEREVSINHRLLAQELLGSDGMPPKLQWMVFKVKQKAIKNYFSKVASKHGDSLDDKRFKFEFEVAGRTKEIDYSYNWPYDFFSMVELIKIEAQVNMHKNEEELPEDE